MTARRRDRPARIVDAVVKIIAEQGWRGVTLESIAAASGLDVAEVYRVTPTSAAMLALFARRIDLEVSEMAGPPAPDEAAPEAPRDRLFDVLMRRFDALEPYRDAIVRLSRDLPRDPPTLAALLPQAHRSFAMMLREAGFADTGLTGRARIAALMAVWMAALRVWLHDDTADRAKTMAALDRQIGRSLEWLPVFSGDETPT